VLDPQISYEGMKIDFANNMMLSKHLEESKSNLFIYFHDNYAHAAISTPPSLLHLLKPHLSWVPPRNPLQLDIIGKRRPRSMNSKNTSNFPLKISMPVIQFSGGWVDALSS
jgi:hypothetical protein